MILKSKKIYSGFTLIELLVTIAVFSLMMVIVVSIFARAVAIERRIVAAQKIQENAMLIIETMAKEIRVSTISNQNSLNCTAASLTMLHPVYGTIIYSLVGGNINRQASFSSFVNSSDVRFTRMNFCITGSGNNDSRSPKVTIIVSVESVKGYPITTNLQTTVTSREIASELEN